MSHLALSALGRDRPGIVAEVTGVLVEHGVNVEDSRMAILRGQFAMVLLLSAPGGLDRRGLEEDLHGVRTRLGLEAVTSRTCPRATRRRPRDRPPHTS